MLSCAEVLALLGEDLDEKSHRLRNELTAHLAHCRNCEVLIDTTQKTLRLITESGSFEVSEELTTRILEGLRRRRGEANDETERETDDVPR